MCVSVCKLDRRTGETDERGARQRVTHVTCKAVNEVILTAVSFVSDHHDIAALGKRRVTVALFLGEKLVDGGEYDAARSY